MNKLTKSLVGIAIALLPMSALAANDFTTPSDASTIVSGFTGNVGSILYSAFPAVLILVASLIGINLLIRWVRRHAK